MSHRKRAYVGPGAPMYRAAAYSTETGQLVSTTGPYATKGGASRSRGWIARRGVRVVVEEAYPFWSAVAGTEVEADAEPQ